MLDAVLRFFQSPDGVFLAGAAAGITVTVVACLLIARVMYGLALVDARHEAREFAAPFHPANDAANGLLEAPESPTAIDDTLRPLAGMVRQLKTVSPTAGTILGGYRALAQTVLDLEGDVRKTARGMNAPGVRVRKELLEVKRTADQMRRLILAAREAQQVGA